MKWKSLVFRPLESSKVAGDIDACEVFTSL